MRPGLACTHPFLWSIFVLSFLISGRSEVPVASYQTHQDLSRDLRALARSHRELVRLRSLAETAQGRDVWLVELGRGLDEDRATRPALLVVAGLEGNDVAGSASVSYWIQSLVAQDATNEAVRAWLHSTTFYVIPRLNPDALSSFFADPKVERLGDGTPVDDDHDGLIDEDGAEDLNSDGLIAWMRVEDADGDHMLARADARLMHEADPLQGEHGAWKLMVEGSDNDGDESWNEDPLGGVNFNRNFPFQYRFFGEDAGRHPVSRPETKALADFVVSQPNIGIVFSFGSPDNLAKAPESESPPKRPPSDMQEQDADFVRELGEAWREKLGLEKELSGRRESGSFSDWMYFHRGRLSLAARAWSAELALALAQSEKADDPDSNTPDQAETEDSEGATAAEESKDSLEEPTANDQSEPDKRIKEEAEYLQWTESHAPEYFLPWQSYDHPDFPGMKVEIGGWSPFSHVAPPPEELTRLAEAHASFLTELAGKLPRVAIRDVTVKPLGKSIYDITVKVENTGYLPTSLRQGATTREVFPTRVTLEVDEALILGGVRQTMLTALEGSGGMKEVRWVCRLPDRESVDVEIVSMLGGRISQTISLETAP